MSKEKILENLKALIGKEPMEMCDLSDEIICAFKDFEEDGETEVIVEEAHVGTSNLAAYINSENSTVFRFEAEKNGEEYTVLDVWIGC